jgi:hypothetical protein
MADPATILNDPDFVSANAATKQAIFAKHVANDPDFKNANPDTQQAIKARFGFEAAPPATSSGIPGARKSAVDQIPGANPNMTQPAPEKPLTLREKVMGAIETPFAVGANVLTAPVTYLAGAGGPEFQRAVGKEITYQPRTRVAQEAVQAVGQAAEASKLPPYMNPMGLEATVAPALRTAGIVGRNTIAPVVNAAAPVVNKLNEIRGNLATGAANTAANLIAPISGKTGTSLKQAYQAGKEGNATFAENMRGKADPDAVLSEIKKGIAQMQTENSNAYASAKTGWAADQTPLDYSKVDAAFNKVKSSLQQDGKWKIGSAEQSIVKEIGDVIEEWRKDNPTALDLDGLKQRIDAIYPESPKHTQAQRAVTNVRNAVKDQIVAQIPEYADAMKAYETQLGVIRDINQALGSSDKTAKSTAINKAMATLKNNPAGQYKQDLAAQLKDLGGVDIMPALAGQDLSNVIPTSGVGRAVAGGGLTAVSMLHNPAYAAVLPFASPRVMGETFYGMGKASGAVGKAAQGVRNMLTNQTMPNMTPEQATYFRNALIMQSQNQNNLR